MASVGGEFYWEKIIKCGYYFLLPFLEDQFIQTKDISFGQASSARTIPVQRCNVSKWQEFRFLRKGEPLPMSLKSGP